MKAMPHWVEIALRYGGIHPTAFVDPVVRSDLALDAAHTFVLIGPYAIVRFTAAFSGFVFVHPGAIIEGRMHHGSEACARARLFPNGVMGSNTRAGNDAQVAGEMCPGSVIGPFGQLRSGGSIGPASQVGAYADIAGIVEHQVSAGARLQVGAGAVVGPASLIGDDVCIGVGAEAYHSNLLLTGARLERLSKARPRSEIGEHAVVKSGADVPAGYVVLDGEVFGTHDTHLTRYSMSGWDGSVECLRCGALVEWGHESDRQPGYCAGGETDIEQVRLYRTWLAVTMRDCASASS